MGASSGVAKVDVRHGIRRWGGMGNFVFGDCVIAAFEHARMVKGTAQASSWQRLLWRVGFRPPHTPYAIGIYAQYLATLGEKPGPAQGVDPALFLPWAESKGLIKAWGTVNADPHFIDAQGRDMRARLRDATAAYNGVMLSISLTENAYRDYNLQTPWDVGPDPADQPDYALGHETLMVVSGPNDDAVVTWGQMKTQTAAFTEATTYAAYVFLDAQDTALPNYGALLANIKNL